jgi:hypothetical protein
LLDLTTARRPSRRASRVVALLGSVAALVAVTAALDLGPESAADADEGVKIDPLALTLRGPASDGVAGADQFDGQDSATDGDPLLPDGQTVDVAVPVMIQSLEKDDDGAFQHEFVTTGAFVRQAYQSAYQQDVTVTYHLQWLTDSGWADVPDAAVVQKTATVAQDETDALGAAAWVLPLKYTDLPDTSYRVSYTATWYGTTGDAKGFELATRTIGPKDVGPAVQCKNVELTCSEDQADGYVTV